MKALIFRGISCGLGKSDCRNLEWRHFDLARGWLNYPRPMTGIAHSATRWAQTLRAQKKLRGLGRFVVVTKYGNSWNKETSDNPMAKGFRKLVGGLGIHLDGRGDDSLTHTFATVASGSLDQVADDLIMGHVPQHIGADYRHRVVPSRRREVAKHVWNWFFQKEVSDRVSTAQKRRTENIVISPFSIIILGR